MPIRKQQINDEIPLYFFGMELEVIDYNYLPKQFYYDDYIKRRSGKIALEKTGQ